jgi:BirA family biotin operon repressor/biotin-[acetyl-CoA-carboxylase] ligase
MSILLKPRMDPRRRGGLALVAGVAARDALLSLGAGPIDVFWPNDLEFRGKKLGGMLGEARTRTAHPGAVVALGIGLNIDLAGVDVPEDLRGTISSIAEAGAIERDPERIAIRILERLFPLYRALEDGVSIPSLVEGKISGVGLPVQIRIPPAPPWEGTVVGVGLEGELLVERKGGGIEGLRSAEVRYGRRPSC